MNKVLRSVNSFTHMTATSHVPVETGHKHGREKTQELQAASYSQKVRRFVTSGP